MKCPKCGREGYVPMAVCDEVLHKLLFCSDSNKFLVDCSDCQADPQKLIEPVKWHPPNWQFADE